MQQELIPLEEVTGSERGWYLNRDLNEEKELLLSKLIFLSEPCSFIFSTYVWERYDFCM